MSGGTGRGMIDRRRLLAVGAVGMSGLSLATALRAEARPPGRGRARACILLYMDGGASHIDMWDMKPDAPAEVRGPFRPIASSQPGIQVCEHLPLMARQMHRVTQIRSVRHDETVHDPAVYQMLTGVKHTNSGGNLKVDPADFPQLGAAFGRVDRVPVTMPRVVELPETMKMGARVLPGQNAGFLGSSWDPFRVEVTPNGEVVQPDLARHPSINLDRLSRRAAMLGRVNGQLSAWEGRAGAGEFDRFQEQALAILAAPQVKEAFDLERERPATRERYGMHRHGQSTLLARRLVEAGARFVTVYWGQEKQDWADGQGARLANNPWDTHRNHFPLLQDSLIPRADQTFSALLDDLHARGLIDETLVVWMGDFGRTPYISQFGSRDHWPNANTVLLAGAGLPRGYVFGATDREGAEVTENPVSPADLTATIFALLGVDPASEIREPNGRPHPISTGTPVAALVE